MLLHSHWVAGYREMSPSRLSSYLAALPEISRRLGGRPELWQIRQVTDADLNLVFRVAGPSGRVCVKQAFGSIKIGDKVRSAPLERAMFEEAALTLQNRLAPGCVPRVLHYDSENFLIITEWLGEHVNLRRALTEGRIFPRLPEQIARFLAQTLFHTSDLGMPALEKRERVAFFCANGELRKITEDLIFTEPYTWSEHNRWSTPELDAEVRATCADQELKQAVALLKYRFLTEPQALLHGDLHTGSVMVTDLDTKVIDPEFACFGPIGFDLGLLIGNLLIAYFSQDGHASAHSPRTASEHWLLDAVEQVWKCFHERFLELWSEGTEGDAFHRAMFEGPGGADALRTVQADFMRRLHIDAVRFAGACMIRRTIGARPVIDFDRIADRARRVACERRSLVLGRELLKDAHHVDDLAEVTRVARQIREDSIAHA